MPPRLIQQAFELQPLDLIYLLGGEPLIPFQLFQYGQNPVLTKTSVKGVNEVSNYGRQQI
jgi:hypothetical protein